MTELKASFPEIWAGVECSIIRTNNSYKDQLQMSGHYQRIDDLNLFHELGIKTIRFPVLWEKLVAKKKDIPDFRYTNTRMKRLSNLFMEPIAGLLHHGSGPSFTNLLDPDFPALFADYAFQVADQYPWIKYYTPINEPLTTARFSGLYGYWYPHKQSNHLFLKMFLNQIKAIILAMKAIRTINPNAALIQTEDLGKVYSTPELSYQAFFENERRWLTYDFLTGKFKPGHLLWNFFLDNGFTEKNLVFFTENSCTPQICGFNYYITSERYLDHRTTLYPPESIGGNGLHQYADVEAIRMEEDLPLGLEGLLTEAWNRYKLPMAVTENHIGCTREEQLRWFMQNYLTVARLNSAAIPVKAITAWAFLGSFDWSSLVKHENGFYEPGVYDVSSGTPEPTALAELIKHINEGKLFDQHLFDAPGWWKRDIRMSYLMNESKPKVHSQIISPAPLIGKQVKCIANVSLQPYIEKILEHRGLAFYFSNDSETYSNPINSPWAVLNLEEVETVVDINESSWMATTKSVNNIKIKWLHDHIPMATVTSTTCTSTEIHTALDLLIDTGGLKSQKSQPGVVRRKMIKHTDKKVEQL